MYSTLSSHVWPSGWQAPPAGTDQAVWTRQMAEQWPGLQEAMRETPQDPVHHAEGDVWTHTRAVVQAALDHPRYATLSPAEQGVVYHAAVTHDIAKPVTTRQVDGRWAAPGHSRRGAIDVRVAGWTHGWPFALREAVCRLVEAHQWPFHAFDDRRGRHPEFIVRHTACSRPLHLLTLLATADLLGREGATRQEGLDNVALFEELAQELGCWTTSYAFPDAPTRMAYLRGEGQRFADDPVHVEHPFEVTVLSGLPASGKSTWAEQQGLPMVSYDDLRAELGFKAGEGTGTVVHAADDRMREHLRRRESFVVNATHLSQQMRSRNLGLIHDYGGQVRLRYFEVPRATLLARNTARNTTLPNAHLLRMTHRWEVPGLCEVEHIDWHVQEHTMQPGYRAQRPQ